MSRPYRNERMPQDAVGASLNSSVVQWDGRDLLVPHCPITASDIEEWQYRVAHNSDCIFCEPDKARIVFETANFMCLAGAGALREGYAIIFPREHVAVSADLSGVLLEEFLSLEGLLTKALVEAFGAGFTAYEHGRVGSCLWAEVRNATGHHCFHAHRNYLPGEYDVTGGLSSYFERTSRLWSPAEIQSLREPYIYLTGSWSREPTIFTAPRHVPSQIVRKLITAAGLSSRQHWDWAQYPNWDLVVASVYSLRSAVLNACVPLATGRHRAAAG